MSCETFVEHDAERVEIAARVDCSWISCKLFRRGVSECAEELADDRRATVDIRRVRTISKARKTEIEHARNAIRIYQDVSWLEIAMNHASTMRVGDAVCDRTKERGDITHARHARFHIRIEPFTLDQLHRKPRFAIARETTFVERDDARMTHARDDFDFAFEAHALTITRELSAEQHLHCARSMR